MYYLNNTGKTLSHLFTAFFIYPLMIPIIITDFCIEIYHRVCFPVYKIPYVKRRRYIKIDRHKLQYLNLFQKINCAYRGYTNGAMNYWVKIGSESEKYWCGIQHQKNRDFKPPKYHHDFLEHDNEEEYKKRYSPK